jgi:hypothetical protein
MKKFVLNFLILATALLAGCKSDKPNTTTTENVTPVEGVISFREQGLPGFVDKVEGLANPEAFGRWTVANTVNIYLNQPVPQDVKIKVTCLGYGENKTLPSKIIIGNQEGYFTPSVDWKAYEVSLKLPTAGEKVISIIPAKPTRPKDVGAGADSRPLGLALSSISIEGN